MTIPVTGQVRGSTARVASCIAAAGFDEVWSSESNGADAFSPLLATAAVEPGLGLGTAIASYLNRGPALLAQQALGLMDNSAATVRLGIGSSSLPIVSGWNGMEFDTRIARARDTLLFLRQAMTGERADGPFDTFLARGFKFREPPQVAPRILLAALGPRMIELARSEADGVILNWLSANDVGTVLADGGHRSEVVCRVMICPEADPAPLRDQLRPLFAGYLSVPTYRAFQRRLGRGEALAPMWKAWTEGDRARAAALVPDEVIDELVVHGTVDRCVERLVRYSEAGVDSVVLAPVLAPTAGVTEIHWDVMAKIVSRWRARIAAPTAGHRM
ncbi:LLM class F420-dependent oxidoreductase [Rhodococcus opacus]|uniref:LLM class F420-dependent oxidoreductase n=1 Tax=Rhodococcus opacus TaxID=37919 RepID=A0A2S8J4I1_RHOOP|nr:LLM class F420-dependent oxidoreductase [Rhodococcus opacus]PQP21980.1 LLM class F420-dependent oxidoreductase [Rhodococcus opacus]